MTKIFLAIAGFLGALSVASGAFAAHALKNSLTVKALEIWDVLGHSRLITLDLKGC